MFFKTFQIWLIIQLKLFPHTPYKIGFQHGEHFARNWLLMSENEREEYYNNLHSLYLVLQNKEENPLTAPVYKEGERRDARWPTAWQSRRRELHRVLPRHGLHAPSRDGELLRTRDARELHPAPQRRGDPHTQRRRDQRDPLLRTRHRQSASK